MTTLETNSRRLEFIPPVAHSGEAQPLAYMLRRY